MPTRCRRARQSGVDLTGQVLWATFVRDLATLDKCAGRVANLGPAQVVSALASLGQESGVTPSRVLEMMDELERLLLTVRQRLLSGVIATGS